MWYLQLIYMIDVGYCSWSPFCSEARSHHRCSLSPSFKTSAWWKRMQLAGSLVMCCRTGLANVHIILLCKLYDSLGMGLRDSG